MDGWGVKKTTTTTDKASNVNVYMNGSAYFTV